MVKNKVSLKEASEQMKKLGVNTKVIPVEEFKKGMEVELEHGKIMAVTNVTKNNLNKTAKIALAHIIEMPDYYKRLEKMEKQGNKYWEKKVKPNVLVSKK